jgi:hypothetical protein
MHNDKYAIHKINKHSCIENRLRRYRKQTGIINPYPLRRYRITYSILAYPWVTKCCHSWTSIQKKGNILQIQLWQGCVHEAKKRQKLEVFIWRHGVYIPKSWTTFRGILICAIFRPRDMQEYYMLFCIFARDMGL